MASTDRVVVTLGVHGQVQGVGFRWWVRMRLAELELSGSATNLADGTVVVVARGPRRTLEQLIREIGDGNAPGRVTRTSPGWGPDPQVPAGEHLTEASSSDTSSPDADE